MAFVGFLHSSVTWAGEHYILSLCGAWILLYLIFQALGPKYPANLPLLGEPRGSRRFSLRTRLAYYKDCASLYRDAYENYSKKGKTVVVPGVGTRREVVLPHSAMRWLLSQPEDALSVGGALVEIDQVVYSLGHEKYVSDPWQGNLVRTKLNLVLETIVTGLADELGHAFDRYFGTDSTNWKELDLYDAVKLVVAQTSSRFTVGLPLCRDEDYLRDSMYLADALVENAGVTGGCPRFLRPFMGALYTAKLAKPIQRVRAKAAPLFAERRAIIDAIAQGADIPEPGDHLQMMMNFARKERPVEYTHDEDLTRRLVISNFASMHQTSIQVTNMLLNIVGSDAEYNTIAELREETQAVLRDSPDVRWTKAKVGKMVKSDSVARETLRLHSFGNRSVFRKVVRNGVVTPDGVTLPVGAIVSFLSYPVHADSEIYDNPLKYDPFRHSRLRQAASSEAGANEPQGETKNAGGVSFVSTSVQHLPFGHGKHACPGRFLIDYELKMIISYVLERYDIRLPEQYGGKRPDNRWVTEAILPPQNVKILVKRRDV